MTLTPTEASASFLALPHETPEGFFPAVVASQQPQIREMRTRADRLYARSLGPREGAALRLIEQDPGISIAELARAMDVSMSRSGSTSIGSKRAASVVRLRREPIRRDCE